MNAFERRREAILGELSKPEGQYSDRSPKGSVDSQIRDLVEVINSYPDLVTTSSCSGRISVFLEGSKEALVSRSEFSLDSTPRDAEASEEATTKPLSNRSGGKGPGGKWLFVSHEPLCDDKKDSSLHKLFDLRGEDDNLQSDECGLDPTANRLIHFKFEPMEMPANGNDLLKLQILHVLAANATIAHHVLASAHQAGLRESGASNIEAGDYGARSKKSDENVSLQPIPLAIRTTGMAFDNIIGFAPGPTQDRSDSAEFYCSLVSERYLRTLTAIANQKFATNAAKMGRFQDILRERLDQSIAKEVAWEDPALRKERKRKEGLLRKTQLQENVQC